MRADDKADKGVLYFKCSQIVCLFACIKSLQLEVSSRVSAFSDVGALYSSASDNNADGDV